MEESSTHSERRESSESPRSLIAIPLNTREARVESLSNRPSIFFFVSEFAKDQP